VRLTRSHIVAIVLGCLIFLGAIALFLELRPSLVGEEPGPSVAGTFICEKTGTRWEGRAYLAHKYDPYVYCEATKARTARKAIQCPNCHTWVLPPLPPPVRPFAMMTQGEYERWEQARLDLLSSFSCPKCNTPLGPGRAVAGPARYTPGVEKVAPGEGGVSERRPSGTAAGLGEKRPEGANVPGRERGPETVPPGGVSGPARREPGATPERTTPAERRRLEQQRARVTSAGQRGTRQRKMWVDPNLVTTPYERAQDERMKNVEENK